MKAYLKKMKAYRYYNSAKEWIVGKISLISPYYVSQYRYRCAFHRKMDLKNPVEFNEKLMWLKLYIYNKSPLIKRCADKVLVRDYVREKGCEDILIEKIGIYSSVDEIPWDCLPEQFVLKCNHGAGYNIVCPQKRNMDIEKAKAQLKKWLKEDYSLSYAEMQYHNMPRKIICEKYLKPDNGLLPDDYKVYCFEGKANCVMLCKEREEGVCKFYFFDREWNFLPWDTSTAELPTVQIPKPVCLERMIRTAEILSEGIPFVRIDFYVFEDTLYFGEMTFTPSGCVDKDYTVEGNNRLSEMLRIPL